MIGKHSKDKGKPKENIGIPKEHHMDTIGKPRENLRET